VKVFITGGAGFIGSHLADAHIERGDEVFILDDLSTGSIYNIDHLRTNPSFHYEIGRVQNVSLTAELVDRADVIYHLAAAVGVRLIIDSPVDTIENNLQGTEIVLAAAARKGKRVLFTSTSEVYGTSENIPFSEDGRLVLGATTRGRWSYACAKAIDEFLALSYFRGRRLPAIVARLFNTVGPRQTGHYGMVVPTFVRQALEGRPITVYGDGSQSRCFGYVGDVVEGLVGLMDHPDSPGQVFNIGNNEEITILELAECVRELTGSTSPIVTVPYDKAYGDGFEDMPRRVPDISKIATFTGYRPRTSLDDILRAVIAHVKNELAGASRAGGAMSVV
jgi:UDP-glucose 4-epimerase